jgi:exodeoxyribonuclease-3
MAEHDKEGRVLTLEFDDFYLVNVYSPNSQPKLARLDYRITWEEALRNYFNQLDQQKPVVFCGDLNVAHQEIDLKNPKANRQNAGFSDQERAKFRALEGFHRYHRYFFPNQKMPQLVVLSFQRPCTMGMENRLFCVSQRLNEQLVSAKSIPRSGDRSLSG